MAWPVLSGSVAVMLTRANASKVIINNSVMVNSPIRHGRRVISPRFEHNLPRGQEIHRAQLVTRPLTGRSRDNLPNPHTDKDNPYLPSNSPAIGDLFDMFDFGHRADDDQQKRG